jgi:FG-GAP-like repeat
MPPPPPITLASCTVVLALAASGCVERLIHDRLCGDGRLSRGEVCLGEGTRSSLTIESLAPLALRVADFDGDGPPDLMVLGTDAAGVVTARLWLGDGDGGFAPPFDPGISGCSAHPVPGSIDDDAITDLLVADCTPTMSLFRGTSSGRFEPPITVVTAVTTLGSGLFDLDDDGLHEIVVLGPEGSGTLALTVSEREASGTFAPPVVSPVIGPPGDFSPTGFGVLDLDGDPFPDLVLVHGGYPQGLAFAHGQAGLRFGPARLVAPAGLVPDGATPRDLDSDGRVELLVSSYADEAFIVLDVEGAGPDAALVERLRTTLPGLRPGPTVLADLDDDGRPDLLRVEPGAAKLEARLGGAEGRLGAPTRIDLDVPADQLAAADLDEDGALDIVVGSFGESVVRVLLTSP